MVSIDPSLAENGSSAATVSSSRAAAGGRLEPIAIVGMSCRLPGSASNTSKLWELLKNGRSAWSKTPKERFNQESFHDSSTNDIKAGTTNTDGGHFLQNDVKAFDASFFGINPVEATAMDPQQRLVLEIAYEAFENAGLTIDQLSGSNTGVYVGQWASDYQEILVRDTDFPPTYQVTGVGPAISSNRVSYCFNLKGPSFTLDTGCSASLVALHQAVQSLRAGESDKCFVAGVNLLLDPQRYAYQSRLKMFSNHGKSYSFDHRALEASGYGRGEGCSGVVLMPLSEAKKQGQPIRAVIRNSVINQDGKTQGISVPSASAQSAAIERAYSQIGLPPYADYVEAHGTGTKVGDPIEAKAIAKILGASRAPGSPLPIGSLKANIGHLESAAGLTGLIKAVLVLENNSIPPQANFEKANPEIDLDALNIRIPTEVESGFINRVSVNSFGYGGTNAHVIVDSATSAIVKELEQPSKINGVHTNGYTNGHTSNGQNTPSTSEDEDEPSKAQSQLFLFSSASERSGQDMAAALAEYLGNRSEQGELLDRLAYTLHRRSILDHRVGIVASGREDLISQLSKLATEPISRSDRQTSPRIAFAFGGQGAQYPGMAKELLGAWPTFTASMKRAAQAIKHCGSPWDLFEELVKEKEVSRMEDPCIAQPISTAVQVALVDALKELGVTPVAVTGHSSGEISAAYCAGAIPFEDAIKISYHRGRLTSELRAEKKGKPGAMMAVGASPQTAKQAIEQLDKASQARITVACYNSPNSVTVSGDEDVVAALKGKLDEQDVWNRLLRTGGAAYHSPQMLQIASKYHESLKEVAGGAAVSHITMASSVTGDVLGEKAINRDYWVHNLVSPVRFSDALKKACVEKDGARRADLVLEIGSHFQMESPIKQTVRTFSGDASKISYTGTLKRGQDAHVSMLEMLRSLYQNKVPIIFWSAHKTPSLLTDLPPYPFDHSKTFWHESRVSAAYRNRQFLPHELLGALVHDNNPTEPRWRCFLNLKEVPWLNGHVIQGQTIFPAAGYIAMALQSARQDTFIRDPEAKIDRFVLRNVTISQALVMNSNKTDLEISLSLRPQPVSARKSSKLWQEFRVFTTTSDNVWTEHCRGLLQVVLKSAEVVDSGDGFASSRTQVKLPSYSQHIKPKKFYHRANDLGLNWGTPFDNLTDIRTTEGASVSNAAFEVDGSSQYTIHPGVLDSCLYHGMMAILIFEDKISSPVVPTFIEKLIVAEQDPSQPVQEVTCHAARTKSLLTFDIGISEKDKEDKMVLQAFGIAATKLPDLSIGESRGRDLCHVVDWVTYMPKTTEKHIEKLCKANIEDKSILAQHRALVALTLNYVKHSLATTTTADLPEDGYQHRWFAWMQTIANEEVDPALLAVAEADDSIVAQAVKRLGPQLNELLRGSVHPLSLLTDGNLLSKLYSEERCMRCIDQISAYVGELGRQNPSMKVLEVGAGTGSSSLPILQALQSNGKVLASAFDFTDISSGFFPSAMELLSDFENIVNFKVLNVEETPDISNFEPNSYDVIIAVNVIHATTRIDPVLENMRSLLRPGGKLVLMELTENRPYYNFVFGAFSGWWAGYDEGRQLSPLLLRTEWVQRLGQAGFAHSEPLFWDYPVADGGTITVFVADNPEPTPTEAPLSIDIVTANQSEISFKNKLQKQFWDRNIEFSSLSSPVGDDKLSIILPELCDRVAWDIDGELFDSLKTRIIGSKAVMFLTRTANDKDSRPGGDWVYGFCRSIRQEHTSVRLISVEIESELDDCLEPLSTILNSKTLDLRIPNGDVELEFVEKEGQLFVSRVRPDLSLDNHIRRELGDWPAEEAPFINNRSMLAELAVPGVLDTIRWIDDPEVTPELDPDYIKLQLGAASINFKDVLIASGQLEGITRMQNDCSGVVLEVGANMKDRFKPGDRVCALYSQSYTNYPIVHGDCCHGIPDELDLTSAASIPIVYTTAYYSLVYAAKMKKGESILIHSAAGAVGQAAIMLAQYIGASHIFVTCGTEAKADLLVNEFGINRDHIFSSRTTAFQEKIMALTGGEGVDVVLNSLSGEMFRESCNSLAPFGRFVEIGRKDLMEDALMPMEYLLKNITFAYVDLAHVIVTRKKLAHALLKEVMELFAAKSIQPVRITKFPISSIGEAFRLIQAGKHTGKVILTVEEDQKVQVVEPKPLPAQLQADATYIVVGGLGGLGRRIVDWMAEKGARNIVIFSRSAQIDSETQSFLDRLASEGVTVRVDKCDVTSEESLSVTLVNIGSTLPPVRGVIQAAMVLHDILLDDMTVEQWSKATAPKIRGTWNLHTLLPQDMDFFVMLSSVVSVVGNIGSSNYAAACSYQDGIAHYRKRLGLPAYSINVGAVVEAGYVSENPEVAATLRRNGLGNVTIAEFFSHLSQAIKNETGHCQSSVGLVPSGTERGLEAMYWTNDKKFAHLGRENQVGSKNAGSADDVGSVLQAATTYEEAKEAVLGAIIKQLATILALGADEIIPARSLDSYGVDSLVGVELRNWISAYLQVNLPLLVMWSANSIDELAEIVTKGSRLVRVKPEGEQEKSEE